MAFYPYRGDATVRYYPKTASTVLSANGVVSLASGQLIKATTTTTVNPGVCLREVTASDTDYTAITMLPVYMSTPDLEFIADVGAGVFTAALVGTTCDLLAGGLTIDVGTDVHHQVTITGFISSTKALVKINDNIDYKQAS